jgi:hypothetical protein
MLDAGYWILDTGYWILDTGYWILDTGYWILDKIMQKLLILLIIAAACMAVYFSHQLLKKFLDPKRSFGHFTLYILFHFAAVFIIVYGVSFLLFKQSHFLFKR